MSDDNIPTEEAIREVKLWELEPYREAIKKLLQKHPMKDLPRLGEEQLHIRARYCLSIPIASMTYSGHQASRRIGMLSRNGVTRFTLVGSRNSA